jgi:hypothetical protein
VIFVTDRAAALKSSPAGSSGDRLAAATDLLPNVTEAYALSELSSAQNQVRELLETHAEFEDAVGTSSVDVVLVDDYDVVL